MMLKSSRKKILYVLSIVCLLLQNQANAERNASEFNKVNQLSFDYSELECKFSLDPVKPIAGAEIGIDETVVVALNYELYNVPRGIQITAFPGIISNVHDFQNFLPVRGIAFPGDNTLLNDYSSPAALKLRGELIFQYVNRGEEAGSFDAIITTIKFARKADKNQTFSLKPKGFSTTPNVSSIAIGTQEISCERDITKTVNWTFLGK